MTIQQFIEKAIEGGWKDLHAFRHYNGAWVLVELKELCWREGEGGEGDTQVQQTTSFKLEEILLDPLTWKAVGKVEGWEKGRTYRQSVPARKGPNGATYRACIRMQRTAPRPNQWKKNMHAMIDALAEGKSIEEFLATL